MMSVDNPDRYYLSVDWGTSSLRVRLAQTRADGTARVVAQVRSPNGVSSIHAQVLTAGSDRAAAFSLVLNEQLVLLGHRTDVPLAQLPLVISGMAGSTLGWLELPYSHVPFALSGDGLTVKRLVPRMQMACGEVFLASGVCTDHDVMRGEETEILGLFSDSALVDCRENSLVILPGTHSKHVMIRHGNIVDFSTCMTGELFDILSRYGVLSASLGPEPIALNLQDGNQERSFDEGVAAGLQGSLLQDLFRVRTRDLLSEKSVSENRAWLRGLLLGAEIFSLKRQYPLLTRPLIAAGGHLQAAYQRAFAIANIDVKLLSADHVENAAVNGHGVLLRMVDARAQ